MVEVNDLMASFRQVLEGKPAGIVLDLAGVPMIASAGMGTMIALRRDAAKINATVRLAAVRPQVREALRRALFDRIFQFYDTVEAAIGAA
jgi:anti-sigma B factor antagonist